MAMNDNPLCWPLYEAVEFKLKTRRVDETKFASKLRPT
jgi:hypothetical protein